MHTNLHCKQNIHEGLWSATCKFLINTMLLLFLCNAEQFINPMCYLYQYFASQWDIFQDIQLAFGLSSCKQCLSIWNWCSLPIKNHNGPTYNFYYYYFKTLWKVQRLHPHTYDQLKELWETYTYMCTGGNLGNTVCVHVCVCVGGGK